MKNRAIVSERGTVTIPDVIRRRSHIHPGDIIEFNPQNNRIILTHLFVKPSDEEPFMDDEEWKRFDKLVKRQVKKGQYTSYNDLKKAKGHSNNLLRKR